MKYLQFIGTQRSGSNLLRVMLNQLPEISAPHPPHILKTFIPLLPKYGPLDQTKSLRLLTDDVCEWVNRNPVSWAPYHADPENVLSVMKYSGLAGIFTAISEGKAVSDGAEIWCCKSMESVVYSDFIEGAGLRPLYIHLYRDGRDVALSFKKAIVGPKHIYPLAVKWAREQELAIQLRQQVPPDRFISLCYEDLIRNPEAELVRLCAAIGVEFRSSMMEYFRSDESKRTAHAGKMWENLEKPVMASNTQKFRSGLTAVELEIFEQIAGRVLTLLDYELVSKPKVGFTFTDEQISEFNSINKELMRISMMNADPGDVARRKPQEILLDEIQQRDNF